MSDEYQLRKDIDFVIDFANRLRASGVESEVFWDTITDITKQFDGYYTKAEIDNITDKSEQSTENNKITILALGLPYFEITSDGNLELEEGLVSNWINKFSINEDGELIYTDDDTNRFEINDDGELIYTR